MTSRGAFLNKTYNAYAHRKIPGEDVELTHVGPGTPGGEYLRRFWHPVIYMEELTDVPVATRILGEDLVVFQDFSGQLGVLEANCPHGRHSLEFGSVCERGIRCRHGWLIDVDGTILEIPGEPGNCPLEDRQFHGAYATHEAAGAVFVYMGPPDKKPPFPVFDSWVRPGYHIVAGPRYDYSCNWLQIAENAQDPVHTAFLHTIVSGAQFTEEFGVVPELDYIETPLGLAYVATRRVGDNVWLRMVDSVLPNLMMVSPVWEDGKEIHPFDGPMMSRWIVPRDDRTTLQVEFRHVSNEQEVTPHWWANRVGMPGQMPDNRTYEQRQREPGDFDAQIAQRPIAVHGLEHLATSDRGVILFRQQLRRGIQAVREGREPDGLLKQSASVIPTYANDTVIRLPEADTPGGDKLLMKETGLRLAKEYLKNPPLMG